MALRYEYPNNAYIDVKSLDLKRLPALREPSSLVYNGTADIDDFVSELRGKPYCKVVGPTGVGKSTVLPKLVALKTKKLVFVVTAHPMLAYSGYDFFRTHKNHGVDASSLRGCLMTDNDIDVSQYDIIWVSAARLVSWMILSTKDGSITECINDSVIFLDEAHEADAYTHVVRTVTPHCDIHALLLVSATFEPQGHDLDSKRVRVSTYNQELQPKSWEVSALGFPWSYNNIGSAALVYIDYDYDANSLVSQYKALGYESYRLTSRSSTEEFLKATSRINDPRAPPVVLVVDSSYRSGFNFDVDVIIDSGMRYVMSGETGVMTCNKRWIYNVEMVQTAGRGGRFGKLTKYYMPNIDPPWRICDLEPVEKEAAAFLTRCCGFFPCRETAATVMAYDDLPFGCDIKLALNGATPLSCYVRDRHGGRKQGTRTVSVVAPGPKSLKNPSQSLVTVDKNPPKRINLPQSVVESEKHYKNSIMSQPAAKEERSVVRFSVDRRPTVETVVSTSTISTRLTKQSLLMLDQQNKISAVYRTVPLVQEDSSAVVNSRVGSVEMEKRSSIRKPPVKMSDRKRPPTVLAGNLESVPETAVAHSRLHCPTEVDYFKKFTTSISPRDSVSQLSSPTRPNMASAVMDEDFRDNVTVRFETVPKSILRAPVPTAYVLGNDDDKSRVAQSINNIWEQLLQSVDVQRAEPIRCGEYMYCAEVDTADVVPYSRYFPNAEKSVLDLLNHGKLMRLAGTLDHDHIKYALYHALKKYNTLTMEINAVKRGMTLCLVGKLKHENATVTRNMFENVVNTVAKWEIERDSFYAAILGLAADNFSIVPMPGVGKVESKLAGEYLRCFSDELKKRGRKHNATITDWIIRDVKCDDLIHQSSKSLKDKPNIKGKSKGTDEYPVKVVYVKPMIGISTITKNPDNSYEVKPRRIWRNLTGIKRLTIQDVEVVSDGKIDKVKTKNVR